jgi:hypothetical protein
LACLMHSLLHSTYLVTFTSLINFYFNQYFHT